MSDITNDDVVNFLGNMTVMEMIALTKELEQKWGVKAEPQTTAMPNTNIPVENPATQTEFTVVLASVPPADKKMTVIKAVRELLGLGLLESKQLVEAAPKPLKEGVSKEEAEDLKAKFTAAGAVIEMK